MRRRISPQSRSVQPTTGANLVCSTGSTAKKNRRPAPPFRGPQEILQSGFPACVAIGVANWVAPGVHAPPPLTVESPGQLPPVFFFGSLDRDSYESNSEGWAARYERPDQDGVIEVTYDRTRGSLFALSSWRGITGVWGISLDGEWLPLLSALARNSAFPHWVSLRQAELSDRFNLIYDDSLPLALRDIYSPPFGRLHEISVPLPLRALGSAFHCQNAFGSDARITGPVESRAELTTSTVYYEDGKCPDHILTPPAIAEFTEASVGFPPAVRPKWIKPGDGSRMLRVERVHYSLAVTCTFGDLYYVLQNMEAFQLVAGAPAGVDSYEYYRRPEFTARVLTGGGACVADASVLDGLMTREIRYRALNPLRALFKTQPWPSCQSF